MYIYAVFHPDLGNIYYCLLLLSLVSLVFSLPGLCVCICALSDAVRGPEIPLTPQTHHLQTDYDSYDHISTCVCELCMTSASSSE